MATNEAQRYRQAAEETLGQLDWCIDYFRRIHKERISAQLARNTAHIRSLLQEPREPAETRRQSTAQTRR